MWQHGGYAWRPGYWAELRPDWVWVPAHHVWCPRGYVFIDGYWDHVVSQRGVLFAPVYFEKGVVARRVSAYSPRVAINLDLVTDHLFVRPQYHHYYFGDYYAASYQEVGFHPAFSFQVRRYGYDPIYAHLRWEHRHESDWDRRVEATFVQRREHESARPPRTLSASIELRSRRAEPEARSLILATSINQLAKRPTGAVRFKQVDVEERKTFVERVQASRKSRDERNEIEAKDVRLPSEGGMERPVPVRAKLPKSPIQAKPGRDADVGHAPPQKYVAPQPDPSVKPKPKKAKSEDPRDKGQGKDKKKDKDD